MSMARKRQPGQELLGLLWTTEVSDDQARILREAMEALGASTTEAQQHALN